MELKTAKKSNIKLRIGLSGASGFGKTYSALLMAYGITQNWSKVAVIDTENNSANLYAGLGEFKTLSLNAPYSPERFIEAIKFCESENVELIIIDSISHEWNGKGGCLEIHEKLGGRFQDWAKITPRHQAFVDAILNSNCHIITTTRRKTDYSLDVVGNGKSKVFKHGTKEITRDGFEYELTVNFEIINDNHLAKASKDRTSLFSNRPEFVINSNTGKKLKDWCEEIDETSLDDVYREIQNCKSLDELRQLYKRNKHLENEILPQLQIRKQEIKEFENQLVEAENID
ncbi:MAG: AAA family ATPase [Psychroflexus halocasei]